MTNEERSDAHQTYSDWYKEVNGFRPRTDTSGWTLENFEAEFDGLRRMQARADEEEAGRERYAATRRAEAAHRRAHTDNPVSGPGWTLTRG